LIYLDHAATTQTDPRVVEAMMPYLTYEFGNPGSVHPYGKSAREAVDRAREQTARFFNCDPSQILFTSGGTEGNNMIFSGIVPELQRRNKHTVVVSGIEHDSVWKSAQRMKERFGFRLRICYPNAHGEITRSPVRNLTDEDTGFVSVMAANNETGVVNDIKGIGAVCHNRGILYHADAVQFASVEAPDTKELFHDCDFITVSGHKLGGPKGIGALFVRDPNLLEPLIVGGAEQEFGFRGGTENVPGIVGLGRACEILCEEQQKHRAYLASQHSQLIFQLKNLAQQSGVEMRVNGEVQVILPKTLNVCFPGIDAQSLVLLLASDGICVSAGSACRAHEHIPSRVLTAMGLSDEDASSSIRISLSHTTRPEEIDEAASKIICAVKAMKDLQCRT
jgi:cysteine desulfurase